MSETEWLAWGQGSGCWGGWAPVRKTGGAQVSFEPVAGASGVRGISAGVEPAGAT